MSTPHHRRIVFLDVDGVLNNRAWVDQLLRGDEEPESAFAAFQSLLDPEAVAHLNEIVAHTDAVVVVSSAWREVMTLDEIREALSSRGFEGHVVDTTPTLPRGRGHQIAAWIEEHGVESVCFVALDDEHDMAPIEAACVKTDSAVGLTRDHVLQAIELLLAGPPPRS